MIVAFGVVSLIIYLALAGLALRSAWVQRNWGWGCIFAALLLVGGRWAFVLTQTGLFDRPVEIASQAVAFAGAVLLFIGAVGLERGRRRRSGERESLVRGRDRFRRAFESNMVPAGMWTREGAITDANDALLNLTGYSREDLEGGRIRWRDMTPPEYRAVEARAHEELRERGVCTPFEKEYIRKDGQRVPILAGGATFDDTPDAGVFFVIDLTPLRSALAALARSEERLRLAFQCTNDLIYEWDLATGGLEWFGDIDAALGYAPGEFERTNAAWDRSLHPDDRDRVQTAIDRHLESGARLSEEYRIFRKDGSIAHWTDRGQVVRDARGKPVRWIGAITDITAFKAAEQTLLDRNRFIDRIAATVPDLLYVYDLREKRPVYVNGRVVDILGYSPEDVAAMNDDFVARLVHPDDRRCVQTALARWEHARDGDVLTGELRVRDARDRWRVLATRETAFARDPDGRVRQIVGVAEDVTERREIEDRVRESEERFRLILEGVPVVVWEADAQTLRFTYVSGQAERILGYPPEAWYREGFWVERLHPEDRERAIACCREATLRGESHEFEYRLRAVDGRDVWIRDLASVDADPGQPPRLRGVMLDVTERKHAEAARDESEARWRSLAENAPVFIATLDREHCIRFINRTVPGLNVPEVADRSVYDFVAPEHHANLRQSIARVFEAGATETIEIAAVGAHGSTAWYSVTVGPLFQDGEIGSAMLLSVDVTDRIRAQAERNELLERLQLMLDRMPLGCLLIDVDFHFTYWNPAAERIFGYRFEEVRGRHPFGFITPTTSQPFVEDIFRRLAQGEETINALGENATKDGRTIVCEWQNMPLRRADGTFVGILSMCQDVTERQRAQRRQALMMQELDHRVKNNLAAVLSIAEHTRAHSDSLEAFAKAFEGRIKALARTHSALALTKWQGLELSELVRLTLEPYRTGEGGRLIVIDGPSMMLPARAAQPLCMALHELATNAVKYGSLSAAGGRVRISWRPLAPGGFELSWIEAGGPTVAPPSRKGFGTSLVQGVIEYELGGRLQMEFAPAGLQCRIKLPALNHAESATSVVAAPA